MGETVAETRRFDMHPGLLLDVIKRQAGTLSKAVLEGVMNAVDAKAKRCDITLEKGILHISDDGHGFRGREEIIKFFEVFGQPHTEEEDKTYGTFRMGRGQLFAYGVNTWRSGQHLMEVDVQNCGLDYKLKELKDSHPGCEIEVMLYSKLDRSGMMDVERSVARMVKYVPMTITLNGKELTVDPAKEKWTLVTNDAYVRLSAGSCLALYNLGVHVKDWGSYRFGTGGIIVSRKQLVVNFARNDVMTSECKVWKRISREINKRATDKNKRCPSLDDGSRQRLSDQLLQEDLDYEDRETWNLKLITDVCGRQWGVSGLARASYERHNKITSAPRGDLRGDKVHQSKLAFVIAGETLDRFHVEHVKELIKKLSALPRSPFRHYQAKAVPYKDVVAGMSEHHILIEPGKWTEIEKVWMSLCRSKAWMLFYITQDAKGGCRPERERKVVIGESDASEGWTDGSAYVAIDRSWLKQRRMELRGFMQVADLLLHELCHGESDMDSHTHSPEFYQLFHDKREGAIDAALCMFGQLQPALKRAKRRLTRNAAIQLDKNDDNDKLVKQVEELVAQYGP